MRALVLLLLGVVLVRLASGDLITHFVRPGARVRVVVAGGVIAVLAVSALRSPASAHGHAHGSRLGWLVLAPVIALLVLRPPALGAYTASRASVPALARPGSPFAALPARGVTRLSVVELALRAMDRRGATLHGRAVAVVGFVADARQPRGFVLARLVITCCAADARPVEVAVRGAARPPRDAWVRVVGRFAGTTGADDEPVLAAVRVDAVAAPADPYES